MDKAEKFGFNILFLIKLVLSIIREGSGKWNLLGDFLDITTNVVELLLNFPPLSNVFLLQLSVAKLKGKFSFSLSLQESLNLFIL